MFQWGIRIELTVACSFVILALLAACGDGEKAVSGSKRRDSPTPRKAEITFGEMGIQGPSDSRDWPTESFTEQANKQLFRLKAYFKGQADWPADMVSKAVADTVLRPSALQTVLEDDHFYIQRGTGGDGDTLRDLAAPYQSESRHAKFKIFDVRQESRRVQTKIAASLSGKTDRGSQQETSTWEVAWSLDSDPQILIIELQEYEVSLTKRSQTGSAFQDATEAVFKDVAAYGDQLAYGVDHWATRIEAAFGIGVSGWEGLALGDANGDGLDDLYVCQPGGLPNRLFIRKPVGTVFDASSFAGVDWRLQTQSALFVDLDNDHDQDLVLGTTLGLILMANDGRGTFTVKASQLIPEGAAMSLSSADFDLDGDLDIYVTSYSRRRSMSGVTTLLGRPMPYHDANNGSRNVLFRNDREWKFTNATVELGLDENNRRFSFAASWEDYDNDGDPDLYVANDYGRNNLYRNDKDEEGRHQFVDVAAQAGVEDISAGMSVSWGDYDADGWMDLYVSNMWSSAGNRVAYQRQFQSGADAETLVAMQRHARGNSLFRNLGDGTFQDVSVHQGVTLGRWAWGSRFVDLNSDGWEDLFVANGFITQPDDSGDL